MLRASHLIRMIEIVSPVRSGLRRAPSRPGPRILAASRAASGPRPGRAARRARARVVRRPSMRCRSTRDARPRGGTKAHVRRDESKVRYMYHAEDTETRTRDTRSWIDRGSPACSHLHATPPTGPHRTAPLHVSPDRAQGSRQSNHTRARPPASRSSNASGPPFLEIRGRKPRPTAERAERAD